MAIRRKKKFRGNYVQKGTRDFRKWNKEPKYSYALVSFTVFSFFIGTFISIFLNQYTFISTIWWVRISLLCIALAYVFQAVYLKTIYYMRRIEYILAAFFGIAPALIALFFLSNYFIPISERTINVPVIGTKGNSEVQYFHTDEIPCDLKPKTCVVSKEKINLRQNNYLKITLMKGLFGFERITNIEAGDPSVVE